MKIVRRTWSELAQGEIEEMFRLWNRVWPGDDICLEDQIVEKAAPQGPAAMWHMVFEEADLVAAARTFEREIEFRNLNDRVKVLALAGVCSSPDQRGKGFGAAVAIDALSRVDQREYELSLFQTGVPDFYKRLGAGIVENRFVNSLSETDPEADPWWNEFNMIYPEAANWNDGLVDLLGPGY